MIDISQWVCMGIGEVTVASSVCVMTFIDFTAELYSGVGKTIGWSACAGTSNWGCALRNSISVDIDSSWLPNATSQTTVSEQD